MKWFNNLKINKKLFLAFGIVILISVAFGIVSISSSFITGKSYYKGINQNLEVVKNINILTDSVNKYVANVNSYILHTANNTNLSGADEEMERLRAEILNKLSWYKEYLQIKNAKSEYIEFTDKLITDANEYFNGVDKAIELAKKGSTKEAINTIDADYAVCEDLLDGIAIISNSTINGLIKNADTINNFAQTSYIVLDIILIFLVGISIFISLFVSKAIKNPIIKLEKAALAICDGNFNVEMRTNCRDEIGSLSNSLANMTDVFKNLLHEINNTSEKLQEGETDIRINNENYIGNYRAVAESVNTVIDELINDTNVVIECIDEYAKGNFDAEIKQFPGKKKEINVSLDAIRNNFVSLSEDINSMIDAAIKGELNYEISADVYQGDWNNIVNGLNTVLKKIKEPLDSVSAILKELSVGNFKVKIEKNFSGEFEVMKNNLNYTVENVSEYIEDISDTLTKMSRQDLSVETDKQYLGDFKNIQTAIKLILSNFNRLLTEIGKSANEVTAGAKNISENSSRLADGASSQNNSVRSLNSMLKEISNNSVENADKSEKANNIALEAQKAASEGSKKMGEMLEAMQAISNASENISSIIKVIDEIAFQTNILALNAAVEAARAGSHGKGFAVVADEVRGLAGRSQKAASETNELINSSLEKISYGSEIANTTANSLNTMIEQIREIAQLVNECAVASRKEEASLRNVSINVDEISAAAENNNRTSILSASAAEKLVEQADVFNTAVSSFKLNK